MPVELWWGMILVPLTLSRSSHGSLTVARNLARETNARLVLLHVVQFRAARQQFRIRQARLTAELCQNAEMRLNQLARSTNNQADVEIVVSVGNPAEKIVETARRLEADLIVLSTHGCRGWSKWLHRNTALNVTREVIAALGRSKAGINFDALDGKPVNLVILFLVPQGQFQKHLHTVAEMAKILQKPALCYALLQAPDAATMLHIIRSPGIQAFLQGTEGKGHYQIKLPPSGIRR